MLKHDHRMVALALAVAGILPGATQADWARFRGPDGQGISPDTTAAPLFWNESANVKWKVPLPGPGSSSPILVGDKLFVTCWSGYGLDRDDPGDQADLRRHLLCINRQDGRIEWDREVKPYLPEDEYGGMFAEHGYASHTPVSDGEHVFVYFGKTGAMAFDMEGKQLWQTQVGTESDPHNWGSASSPVLYKDLLIVTASAESEALVALDKATGKEVWRQETSGLNGCWGTPVLVEVSPERTDLVLGVPSEIWGFNPETGKLRWFCTGMPTDTFVSSVVAGDGVAYAVEGRGGGSIAVRVGGNGDVAQSHVVWTGQDNNRIGTPVLFAGRLYCSAGGVVTCLDTKNGKKVFQGRLPSTGGGTSGRRGGGRGFGGDYASPVVADGKIYFLSRAGDMYVLETGDSFTVLAHNRITSETEDFSATPAISDGELFLRSSKHLYCVAPLGDVVPRTEPVTQPEVRTDELADRGGGGPAGSRRPRGFDPDAIFKERDTNSDGKLAGDEISERLRDNLTMIDADKDGAVSAQEFRDGLRRMFAGGGGGGGRYGEGPRPGHEDRPKRPDVEE